MNYIYLDNNASTKTDPRVVEKMLPWFNESYANPANFLNGFGRKAECAVQNSREFIADYFHATAPDKIIFTSGATESNNLVLLSAVRNYRKRKKHVITTGIEHASVLNVCKCLEQEGVEITRLPVAPNGLVNIKQIEKSIREDTVLISVMAANNEIGTIQPIKEIGKLAERYNILFHTDATQILAGSRLDLAEVKADFMTFSGHKIHGPKGIGGLYYNSDRVSLAPMIRGGGQEFGCRAGTQNVPGIVGMAEAFRILEDGVEEFSERVRSLRNLLLGGFRERFDVSVNGSMESRIPSNLNLFIPGVSSLALAAELPEIVFSVASSCTFMSGAQSHVLKALGCDEERISQSVRFGLSRFTTEKEIAYTIRRVARVVGKRKGEMKNG